MNNKEKFDFYVGSGTLLQSQASERVQLLVNSLLDCLYKPNIGETEFIIDKERAAYYGVDIKEPVNWGGNLSCSVDVLDDQSYCVIIEEASPDYCPTLCDYIKLFMKSWGWDVSVLTEW